MLLDNMGNAVFIQKLHQSFVFSILLQQLRPEALAHLRAVLFLKIRPPVVCTADKVLKQDLFHRIKIPIEGHAAHAGFFTKLGNIDLCKRFLLHHQQQRLC